VIMGLPAEEDPQIATEFEGKACGEGPYSPGEDPALVVSGGGVYALEVSGATIASPQASCEGTRINAFRPPHNYTLVTDSAATTVHAWIARATGNLSAVKIYTKCTLTAGSSYALSSPTPNSSANESAPCNVSLAASPDQIDYCSEDVVFRVAACNSYSSSRQPTDFDSAASSYDHSVKLSGEMKIAWTIRGNYPNGEITIMMQARTSGWVGFGLMSNVETSGMVHADIYIGNVMCSSPKLELDGVPTVQDSWAPAVAAPVPDRLLDPYHSDIYDVGGYEDSELNITTLWFTRKLVINDTHDYNILPGVQIPVIFAYSRNNADSFTSYHGPTRGSTSIVFILESGPQDLTFVWIISSSVVGLLVVVCSKIDDALDSAGKLHFGMVVMSASDFLKYKKFVPHETLRDRFEVKFFDILSDIREFAEDQNIIFFSHQWLAWDEPDPHQVQFQSMERAIHQIIRQSGRPLEKTWIWLDYSSMPQRNGVTMGLVLTDLSEIAPVCTHFVVIAPETIHLDTSEQCGMDSYQSRG
ncbi:MAG: hypothetical protein SGPRY_014821, partial [Prymnesium sp.]